MNAKTVPKLPTGYWNPSHNNATTPITRAGVANDTPNNRNKAASKRVEATQPITNADLYGFCVVPADCEATLMMVDFQTDAGS
jgi:hypothetical protein